MDKVFTSDYLKKKRIEAMKSKNIPLRNIVSLALGDADTMLKNFSTYVDIEGVKISENEWFKNHISKQLKNMTSNLKIFESRKDDENIEKTKNEINCIKTEFLKQLKEEEIAIMIEEHFKNNPNDLNSPKKFMDYLSEYFEGQYDGSVVAPLFMKEAKKRKK